MEREQKKYLAPNEIVKDIISRLTEGDIKKLERMTEDDLIGLHHTTGQDIRNNYHLWDIDNPYTILDNSLADDFPDQVSQRIIERVWEKVTGNRVEYQYKTIDHGDGSYELIRVKR